MIRLCCICVSSSSSSLFPSPPFPPLLGLFCRPLGVETAGQLAGLRAAFCLLGHLRSVCPPTLNKKQHHIRELKREDHVNVRTHPRMPGRRAALSSVVWAGGRCQIPPPRNGFVCSSPSAYDVLPHRPDMLAILGPLNASSLMCASRQ